MAVPFSNTKLRVPRGFQNLLEGLAREVLRNQPEQLYEFAAQHFEMLLKEREASGTDPAEQGAKMEDRFYNNKAFSQPEIDASDPQQQDAALAIQTKFRQHAAKQEVDSIREEKAATKIQAGFRGYQGRQRVKGIRDPSSAEDADAADGAEVAAEPAEEEVDIDLTDPEVEKAAIKIQAGFKGYKTRKDIQGSAKVSFAPQPPSSSKPRPTPSPERQDQPSSNQETEDNSRAHELSAEADAERETQDSQGPLAEPTEQHEDPQHEEPNDDAAEEVDIDLTDPDVEKAAVKIQAGFKGFKARKDLAQSKQVEPAAEEEVQEEEAQEEEEVDIDLTDPEVEKAAVKIQAGFKGMRTRREMAMKQEELLEPQSHVMEIKPTYTQEKLRPVEVTKSCAPEAMAELMMHEEEVDIDLEDPDVEKAAVKIQAGFRGLKTRREMAERKQTAADASAEPEGEMPADGEPAQEVDPENEAGSQQPELSDESELPKAAETEQPTEKPTEEDNSAAEREEDDTEQVSAETEQAPAAMDDTESASHEAPVADETAAAVDQPPAEAEETAAENEEAPAAAEEAVEESPDTEGAPAESGQPAAGDSTESQPASEQTDEPAANAED